RFLAMVWMAAARAAALTVDTSLERSLMDGRRRTEAKAQRVADPRRGAGSTNPHAIHICRRTVQKIPPGPDDATAARVVRTVVVQGAGWTAADGEGYMALVFRHPRR